MLALLVFFGSASGAPAGFCDGHLAAASAEWCMLNEKIP